LRVGVFTRVYAALGVLAYSLLPVFVSLSAIRARQIEAADVGLMLGEIAILQALLFAAMRRCGSAQLSFGQGVLATAASMKTGWMFLDPVVAPAAVCLLLLISACLVFTRNPAHLYHRVVYAFYDNRMEQ